jgi:hypothetical protein
LDDGRARFGSGKSLQQFLQDEAGREHRLAAVERLPQPIDCRLVLRLVAPECQ